MDDVSRLKAFRPRHEFFVGIDSDGCVFDTMEIKHKECFCPAFIKHFGLQAASTSSPRGSNAASFPRKNDWIRGVVGTAVLGPGARMANLRRLW